AGQALQRRHPAQPPGGQRREPQTQAPEPRQRGCAGQLVGIHRTEGGPRRQSAGALLPAQDRLCLRRPGGLRNPGALAAPQARHGDARPLHSPGGALRPHPPADPADLQPGPGVVQAALCRHRGETRPQHVPQAAVRSDLPHLADGAVRPGSGGPAPDHPRNHRDQQHGRPGAVAGVPHPAAHQGFSPLHRRLRRRLLVADPTGAAAVLGDEDRQDVRDDRAQVPGIAKDRHRHRRPRPGPRPVGDRRGAGGCLDPRISPQHRLRRGPGLPDLPPRGRRHRPRLGPRRGPPAPDLTVRRPRATARRRETSQCPVKPLQSAILLKKPSRGTTTTMHSARLRTGFACSLLWLASQAQANPAASPVESLSMEALVDTLSLEDLANMVVTDTKVAQSRDTVTQNIVVLPGDGLDRQPTPNRNIAELLRHVSGQFVNVLSRNDANWGSYAGLGPKYNSYLLDGLPIDSFVDPMSLDPWAFERIEAHKGPASVLYSNYLTMDF